MGLCNCASMNNPQTQIATNNYPRNNDCILSNNLDAVSKRFDFYQERRLTYFSVFLAKLSVQTNVPICISIGTIMAT